jgi:hypothetical protein
MLLNGGWDVEDVDAVVSHGLKPREKLADLHAELRKSNDTTGKLVTSLRRFNPAVATLRHLPKTTPRWTMAVWDSFTHQPWWTAAPGGQRSIIFTSTSGQALSRVTASFVYDLWMNLGEQPAVRLPVVRRFNLLTWSSAEALHRFETTVGTLTDVAVVYGGLMDANHYHETIGYLSALLSGFKGVLLYEAVIHDDLSPDLLLTAARRAGFPLVFGIGE